MRAATMSLRTTLTVSIMAVASCVPACASDQASPRAADTLVRVIVRFRDARTDPSDRAFLERLAAAAEVTRIELVRPMSGGAYVMNVACTVTDPTAPTDPCSAAVARVGAIGIVLGIEVDGRVRHQ